MFDARLARIVLLAGTGNRSLVATAMASLWSAAFATD